MMILGVDPGTRITGAGIIEVTGNRYRHIYHEMIRIPQGLAIQQKLRTIYERLGEILKTYRPKVLAVENVFYAKDIRAMLKIGEARACAMLAAAEAGIDVVEYLPAKIKKAVAGNGRASKEQIQEMVKSLLCLKERPASDAADALAAAICHAHYGGSRLNRLHEIAVKH